MADFSDFAKFLKGMEIELFSVSANRRRGKIARDLIFKRTKKGFGVTSDKAAKPKKKQLKPLSQSYIAQRTGALRFFTLQTASGRRVVAIPGGGQSIVTGKGGHPTRSNLTLSGQMLDSIKVKATKEAFSLIIPGSSRRGSDKTNAEIARFVRMVRPFFALTRNEQLFLSVDVAKRIRGIARRILL